MASPVPVSYTVVVGPGAPALQFQLDVKLPDGTVRALPVVAEDALTVLALLRLPGHLLFDKENGRLVKEG
jgi:hypothetical protein